MNTEIKKCADENDVKGLRYIFVDCLDVDPTFESYKEDYDYCKKIKGFFDDFEDITPLKNNSAEWNEDYWVKLKVDLLKNFSEKRFRHMIEVAKIVKADKIRRLQKERRESKNEQEKSAVRAKDNMHEVVNSTQIVSFNDDVQKKQFEEKQKELQAEYQRTQAKIEKENRERAERAEKLKAEELARKQQPVKVNDSSKKELGIVALVVVVILIILLVKVIC